MTSGHGPLASSNLYPVAVDFQSNRNLRVDGTKLICADSDIDAVATWLREYENSPQTWRAYRREAERLLLWCAREQRNLSDLGREDMDAYQRFMEQPPVNWIGPRTARTSPNWRPFAGPLKGETIRQALTILGSMFTYLVDSRYLHSNPIRLIRLKARNASLADAAEIDEFSFQEDRFLPKEDWLLILEHIESMSKQTRREESKHERLRFLFSFLYHLAPRVHEAAAAKMNSIRWVRGRAWWFVVGKGAKREKVPVPDAFIHDLARYRVSLGLSERPDFDDTSPLIRSISGKNGIGDNQIYRLTKDVFSCVAESITDQHRAERIKQASTHWVRHTALSHGADNGITPAELKSIARHSSVETTFIYINTSSDQLHDAWTDQKSRTGQK